jgi:hypothetical protein
MLCSFVSDAMSPEVENLSPRLANMITWFFVALLLMSIGRVCLLMRVLEDQPAPRCEAQDARGLMDSQSHLALVKIDWI